VRRAVDEPGLDLPERRDRALEGVPRDQRVACGEILAVEDALQRSPHELAVVL
jgi:hypothetical protein